MGNNDKTHILRFIISGKGKPAIADGLPFNRILTGLVFLTAALWFAG